LGEFELINLQANRNPPELGEARAEVRRVSTMSLEESFIDARLGPDGSTMRILRVTGTGTLSKNRA
jgi:hypothetical protein